MLCSASLEGKGGQGEKERLIPKHRVRLLWTLLTRGLIEMAIETNVSRMVRSENAKAQRGGAHRACLAETSVEEELPLMHSSDFVQHLSVIAPFASSSLHEQTEFKTYSKLYCALRYPSTVVPLNFSLAHYVQLTETSQGGTFQSFAFLACCCHANACRKLANDSSSPIFKIPSFTPKIHDSSTF